MNNELKAYFIIVSTIVGLGIFSLPYVFWYSGFYFLFWLFFIFQWIWPNLLYRILAWVLLVFFGYFKFKFFRSAFNISPYDKWFEFCKMKYLTNLYFLFGGLKKFFKYKVICIEPSF